MCARCPFPLRRGWRLLAGRGVDPGEPGGGESVAAVIFRELSAVLVPGAPQMLRHARVVGVGRESESGLGTLSLPSFSGPVSFTSAPRTYSWRSSQKHGDLACLSFPHPQTPAISHSVTRCHQLM